MEEARAARDKEEKLRTEMARHKEKMEAKRRRKARKSSIPLWKQRAQERAEGKTGTHVDRRKTTTNTTSS